MSRENTSPLPQGDGEGRCLTSSPCAALLWSVALRGIPVHQLLRSSCRAGAPASSVAAMCQPWFYRRLEAYGFVGLFYKRGCQEKTLLPFRMEMEKVGV